MPHQQWRLWSRCAVYQHRWFLQMRLWCWLPRGRVLLRGHWRVHARSYIVRERTVPQLPWVIPVRLRNGIHASRSAHKAVLRGYWRMRYVQQLVRVWAMREHLWDVQMHMRWRIPFRWNRRKLYGYWWMWKPRYMSVWYLHQSTRDPCLWMSTELWTDKLRRWLCW